MRTPRYISCGFVRVATLSRETICSSALFSTIPPGVQPPGVLALPAHPVPPRGPAGARAGGALRPLPQALRALPLQLPVLPAHAVLGQQQGQQGIASFFKVLFGGE